MARQLLWGDDRNIKLEDFVEVSQTCVFLSSVVAYNTNESGSLIDLLTAPDLTSNFTKLKEKLINYYALLDAANITHPILKAVHPQTPFFRSFRSTSLPSLSPMFTLISLVSYLLLAVVQLPLFAVPCVLHLPVYAASSWAELKFGGRDEVEARAQNMIVFGTIAEIVSYVAGFWVVRSGLAYLPVGYGVPGWKRGWWAMGVIALSSWLHVKLVARNYDK